MCLRPAPLPLQTHQVGPTARPSVLLAAAGIRNERGREWRVQRGQIFVQSLRLGIYVICCLPLQQRGAGMLQRALQQQHGALQTGLLHWGQCPQHRGHMEVPLAKAVIVCGHHDWPRQHVCCLRVQLLPAQALPRCGCCVTRRCGLVYQVGQTSPSLPNALAPLPHLPRRHLFRLLQQGCHVVSC
jgi:hypothetical protein